VSVDWLLVATGGALGAAARYLLDRAIAVRQTGPFPLGTLVINVSGSIALGLLLGLAVAHRLPGGVVGGNRVLGCLYDLFDLHL
jgi:fluoride exporter